jgi:hypothetical protein
MKKLGMLLLLLSLGVYSVGCAPKADTPKTDPAPAEKEDAMGGDTAAPAEGEGDAAAPAEGDGDAAPADKEEE